MPIIYLSDVDSHALSDVAAFFSREKLVNPALNGADIRIERGDYTCVEGADAVVGAVLVADVHRIINTLAGRVD
jgi:hypothetical protein